MTSPRPRTKAHSGTADLIQQLSRLAPLTPAATAALESIVTPKAFQQDDWLLRGGDHATMLFFITRGLVRELYVGSGGREHTRTFLAEGGITGSLLDLLSRSPAVTWIQAIEPTHTLAFSYDEFTQLCGQHPCLQLVARRFMEELYVRKVTREHELLTMSARQRYERWTLAGRNLNARIRRRHLASYLGVTPEHLSRLSSRRGR